MSTQWLGRMLRSVRAGNRHSLTNHLALSGVPHSIVVRSGWFEDRGPMPLSSAGLGVGDNISPPLSWTGVPTNTAELALVVEDLDPPLPRPIVHLIAYGIPPDHFLTEDQLAGATPGLSFGKNTLGTKGYTGPRPIPGHGPHRYVFHLLALDRPALLGSAPKLKAFLNAIQGTVIGYGSMSGTYARS
jgi:Raf kinase inhibitor-like YbhB/YbcL family protein